MTKVNKRGHNFILPPDEVKSERYTVKFTKKEFERLEKALKTSGLERMEFSRQAILKFVATFEKPAQTVVKAEPVVKSDIQRMPTLKDVDGDILSLHKQGMTPQEIAKSVGWSVSLVKARIRELAV